ncbi:MAG: hypothetical protein U9R75_10605, partial [Candidatus Thermoplasmatota archaeon]|nr:hypothetical protein [Candidatus Thermoplasmatota archaeon]
MTRSLIDRRRASMLFIFLVNIIVFSIVISYPHDEGERKGTVPDEYAFYAWSEIFMDGKTSIPISDLTTHTECILLTMPETEPLEVDYTVIVDGIDGRKDDISITISFSDGEKVQDADVFITGRQKSISTDETGTVVIENYRFNNAVITARYESGNDSYLGSVLYTPQRSGQMNYNTYVRSIVTTIGVVRFDPNTSHIVDLSLPPGVHHPPPNVLFTILIEGVEIGSIPVETSRDLLIHEHPPFRVWVIDDRDQPLRNGIISIDGEELRLDEKGAATYQGYAEFNIVLSVQDIFDDPVSGADIVIDGELVGRTDTNGELVINRELIIGPHQIIAHKEGLEVQNLHAVVAEDDGEVVLVSRWPPGQSLIIGVFALFGMEWAIALVLLLMGSWAIFRIGEMYRSTTAGTIAALLFSTAGGTVLMTFSRYMGDLSTTVLAVFGFYMFLRSLELCESRRIKFGAPMALIGGLLMAFAIVSRYSTGVVVLAPFFVAAAHKSRSFDLKRRKLDVKRFTGTISGILPFAVGFLVVLIALFSYNSAYFGGPLNSGHQMDQRITVSTDVSEENTTQLEEPSESFVGSYLEFTGEDF